MYGEWYGVCDFVVLSVVVVCIDYGGVNVSHVCLYLCVVYGVVVCVNDCGVVCIVAPNDTAYKRWSCHCGYKQIIPKCD